jgi:hypothetical protein
MGEELSAKCIMGLQPRADIIGDPLVDIEATSHGINKFYPYGLSCYIKRRKLIICYLQ